jgi:hypothetical protein
MKGNTMRKRDSREYEKPKVVSYSGDEILARVGPAQTCSPTPTSCPTGDV